ncbi:hypothetical protein DFH06DRAFT_1418868 [Mycena polygramma]|nr:hypothetical protein DFH06DRAFT_1418868 [Mycena polygramma]
MSAIHTKITRALSTDRGSERRADAETESIASTLVERDDRSPSTSRSPDSTYRSSGRGGAGNFRAYSTAPTSPPPSDTQEFPWPRGRPRAPVSRPAPRMRSTGRGGFGNINPYPPASDPSSSPQARQTLPSRSETDNGVRSSGRGGIGNIAVPAPVREPARN